MRTLSEITAAVRLGQWASLEELRLAVVAYDVMCAHLQIPNDPKQLQTYFQAADTDVQKYIGEANDPAYADARAWYKAMHQVGI